jgi:hypothetical protein
MVMSRPRSAAVAVGLMPKVGEPPAHLEVHCLGPDYNRCLAGRRLLLSLRPRSFPSQRIGLRG